MVVMLSVKVIIISLRIRALQTLCYCINYSDIDKAKLFLMQDNYEELEKELDNNRDNKYFLFEAGRVYDNIYTEVCRSMVANDFFVVFEELKAFKDFIMDEKTNNFTKPPEPPPPPSNPPELRVIHENFSLKDIIKNRSE